MAPMSRVDGWRAVDGVITNSNVRSNFGQIRELTKFRFVGLNAGFALVPSKPPR